MHTSYVTGHDYIGLELRVSHNGQFYPTGLHKERVPFYWRVDELRGMLEAQGWMATKGVA